MKRTNNILKLLAPKLSAVLLVGLLMFGVVALTGDTTFAAGNKDDVQSGIDTVSGNEAGTGAGAFTNLLRNVINLLLFLIGVIAVIMIIVGGIRYVTSNGDQAQVTSAKNTILYAIVGVVIAIMAYAIVNFIVESL